MILPLVLLFVPADANSVIDRCDAFLRSVKTLTVQVEIGSSIKPGKGVGTFSYRVPSDVALKVTWGPSAYTYWGNAKKGLELESADRVYDESIYSNASSGPLCRISDVPVRGYPAMLLPGQFKKHLPLSGTKDLVGAETIGGAKADHVRLITTGRSGKIEVDLWIWRNGTPAKYEMAIESPGGTAKSSISFSGYAINKPLPASTFAAQIPRGYMPFTFEDEPMPIQAGEKILSAGWVDAKTGKTVDLTQGVAGKRLLAVVAPGCQPSVRALDTVRELASSMSVIVLNVGKTPSKAWADSGLRICYDPTGKCLAKLSRPGTPFFILIDGKGIVQRLWFGFDEAGKASFKEDVLNEAGVK
jgi:hypothetical protein